MQVLVSLWGRCAGVKMAVGRASARAGCRAVVSASGVVLRGRAVEWPGRWQGAGGCPLTPVFLSGTQARMQVWRRGLDLRVAHCCL